MSTEPNILFVKPGAIRGADKAKLSKAGIVVVETDDPSAVRLVKAAEAAGITELAHGELLTAAATAILAGAYSKDEQAAFGKAVAQAIIARHGGSTQ